MLRSSLRNPAAAVASLLFVTIVTCPAARAQAETGKELFERVGCVLCHGESGDGRGPMAAAIPDPKPRDFRAGGFRFDSDGDGDAGSDADLRQVIRRGTLAFGGSAIMMPNPTLSDDDIDKLIVFLRSLKR